MAKSTKTTPSKSRSGGDKTTSSKNRSGRKANRRAAAKKSSAPQSRTRARASTKASAKRPQDNEGWVHSIGSLLDSQAGRAILADVLDAAAGALRRNSEAAQQMIASGEAAIDSGRELAGSAVRAGTTAAEGAASAARELAETAIERLADLVGGAARSLLPEPEQRSGSRASGRRKAGGKTKAARR